MNLTISKKTIEAIATLLSESPTGRAALLLGQDIVKLNGPPAQTENQILESHQWKKIKEKEANAKTLDN